ncbi:MAG: penicillin-binding protein 2, partial [Tepidiformaceae bacterium]
MLDGGFRPGGTSRNRPHGHLGVLRIAVILLFAVLTLRLVDMQIVDGEGYRERSVNNHIAQANILPPRGLMVDRNGTPLVDNVPVYSVQLTPDLLPADADAQYTIFLALAGPEMTAVPVLQIQEMVRTAVDEGRGNQPLTIKKHLTHEQALIVEEASIDMPGVSLVVEPGRQYIAGDAFSHILGYIGDMTPEEWERLQDEGYLLNEPIGVAGLEAWYESDLRGKAGVNANEQDAYGKLIEVLETQDAEPGSTLKLAIDAGMQNYVAELLQDSLPDASGQFGDARVASAVVMNVNTGEVYALVTIPTYDNNIFVVPSDENTAEINRLTNDSRKPFLHWALNGAAPGSTFKLVTASAALQEGIITPETGQNAPKVLNVKGENDEIYPLVDWRDHGYINLYDGIAWSSNIYMFRASCGILGETRGLSNKSGATYDDAVILGNYAREFGFDNVTGIDLGAEAPGLIPSPEWKKRTIGEDWFYADTCFMGIGQGDVLATPLQIARMTAAVANGGKLVTPHVVNEVLSPGGELVRRIETSTKAVDVDPEHLAVVREGMHRSVIYGASKRASASGLDIAGKTGTAEFKDYEAGGITRQHAWFTGYYPFDNPEIVVTVYFDLGVGGDKAAPAAAKIFQYFAENVTP